jgi:membrane-bound serine protease (ClpP class)
LIDKKAISAGAFISSATRHIYMTPGSVIGAAAPVMAMPGQGPQAMPESYEEKITSAVRAMVRSSAESHGHRPEVFDAMVDRNQGLKIDGKVLVPEGKLLTLTTKEAEMKLNGKPLLSLGTIPDLQTLIANVGGSGVQVKTLEATGFEKVARFITLISPFLLTAGMALGYLEFKTPGFGFFGILAGLCFVVYFFGHSVAGLSGHEPLLIFLAGVILIVLEVVLFPGLLLPTITGVLLILFAFAFSRVDFYPGAEVLPSWSQFQGPLTQTLYSLLGGFALMALFARWIPNAWLTRGLEEATIHGPSSKIRGGIQVGDSGISSTVLRPSGVGVFGDRSYDVISRGLMIEKGVRVRVVEVSEFRIVVEEEAEGGRL